MSKYVLRPLSDRIVMIPDDPRERTGSGIFIPKSAQENPQTGSVVAVGPGQTSEFPTISAKDPMKVRFERKPMIVKVGDRILVGKYSGTEIEIERDTFVVVRQVDILAVVEDDEGADTTPSPGTD